MQSVVSPDRTESYYRRATLAVKIVRQQKKIALLGSATSAAALRAGHERAPEALRAAGLADRLKTAGFEVADLGDTARLCFPAG
jgi:arginase family enzyme